MRGGLAATGHLLAQGLHTVPGLTVPASEWTAAAALVALESAVHGFLVTVGGRAARIATGLRVAADEYDAVDERAARRFTSMR